jgi:hypothetical protein
MAPMMLPGAHQLMPPMSMGLNSACMPPAAQFLSQIQRVPPFLSNPLPNQIPQISPAATSAPNVTNQVQSNRMAQPRNPFLHPNDALTSTPQVTVRISPLVYIQNFTPSLPQVPILCSCLVYLAMDHRWHKRTRFKSYWLALLLQLWVPTHSLPLMEQERNTTTVQ